MRILPKVKWDEGNDRKNLEKHSVMPMEAEDIFVDNRFFFSEDKKYSTISEQRYNGL